MMPKNGHIRIPNDVWEALISAKLLGAEMSCVMYIIRMTLGWGKKEANISTNQFVEATRVSKGGVSKALKQLQQKGLVKRFLQETKRHASYSFNMKYKKWACFLQETRVSYRKQSVSYRKLHSIKTYIKNNTTSCLDSDESRRSDKNLVKTYLEKNKESYLIAKLLFKLIKKRDVKVKEPNWKTWTEHIEKLHRIDGRSFKEIKDVIRWCQNDDFWQNNILSTAKLRKQFSQLFLKMKNKKKIGTRYIPKENRRGSKSFGKIDKQYTL